MSAHAMKSPALALVALLGLVACQPQTQDGRLTGSATPPKPAVVATEFAVGVDALGTEPFWSVKVRGGQMTVSRLGHADVVVDGASANQAVEQTSWNGRAPDGRDVSLMVWKSDCSDGMSDRTYAYEAAVVIGAETLKGCAGVVGQIQPVI